MKQHDTKDYDRKWHVNMDFATEYVWQFEMLKTNFGNET